MYQELDEIRACIAALEQIEAHNSAAFNDAIGIYANDPVAPTVMALVWRGRLAELKIADSVCQLPTTDAAALINAVLINAFNVWHQDYARRLASSPATGPMLHVS